MLITWGRIQGSIPPPLIKGIEMSIQVFVRKRKSDTEHEPIGRVQSLVIKTPGGEIIIREADESPGIHVEPDVGTLAILSHENGAMMHGVDLVVLGVGYDIIHESESDGG